MPLRSLVKVGAGVRLHKGSGMIIDFEKYRLKRQEEQTLRQELVEQIMICHQSKPEGERADAFYFEHIRSHFSVEMLQDILHRLQQKACNG